MRIEWLQRGFYFGERANGEFISEWSLTKILTLDRQDVFLAVSRFIGQQMYICRCSGLGGIQLIEYCLDKIQLMCAVINQAGFALSKNGLCKPRFYS